MYRSFSASATKQPAGKPSSLLVCTERPRIKMKDEETCKLFRKPEVVTCVYSVFYFYRSFLDLLYRKKKGHRKLFFSATISPRNVPPAQRVKWTEEGEERRMKLKGRPTNQVFVSFLHSCVGRHLTESPRPTTDLKSISSFRISTVLCFCRSDLNQHVTMAVGSGYHAE